MMGPGWAWALYGLKAIGEVLWARLREARGAAGRRFRRLPK
jgi:hypothetical protein